MRIRLACLLLVLLLAPGRLSATLSASFLIAANQG
jgi:hypothetical protein